CVSLPREAAQASEAQLGPHGPVGGPRVVHRIAQPPAGPVQDQAPEAPQLGEQRGEVGARGARAGREQDRRTPVPLTTRTASPDPTSCTRSRTAGQPVSTNRSAGARP